MAMAVILVAVIVVDAINFMVLRILKEAVPFGAASFGYVYLIAHWQSVRINCIEVGS
jgi:hypothetical protein